MRSTEPIPGLRAELEARQVGYVPAVTCDHPVRTGAGTQRADALLKQVPAGAWQCVSAGAGAKGHRWCDWAFVRLDKGDPDHGGRRWLMVRRHRKRGELAFHRCWMPGRCRRTTLAMLAHAFLVVAAVTDRTRHPPPPGLVWLTCNEVQHLFAALLAVPPVTSATGCAGLGGDAGNRPALRPVTTAGKPTDHEDHDLQFGVLSMTRLAAGG